MYKLFKINMKAGTEGGDIYNIPVNHKVDQVLYSSNDVVILILRETTPNTGISSGLAYTISNSTWGTVNTTDSVPSQSDG